jgi:uncharacterized protein (UPF0276 family)
MKFSERVQNLSFLGLGVSTEYDAYRNPNALDIFQSRETMPHCTSFLEIGLEVAKGLDLYSQRWIENQWPTTCHFLDINLDEKEDFDDDWLFDFKKQVHSMKPAWICGDAGLWHFGPRAPEHMLLLPPILTKDSAKALADGIIRLREKTGLEVLPENPPGHVYIGDLHLMDFFAMVCELADTGMLLDVAHLAIYQKAKGLQPTTALDGFPLDRVVELHLAGGEIKKSLDLKYEWIEDSHSPVLLPDSWTILDRISPELHSLKAVIFECERNPLALCQPEMQRIYDYLCVHVEGFRKIF